MRSYRIKSLGLASFSPTITGPAHVHTRNAKIVSMKNSPNVAVVLGNASSIPRAVNPSDIPTGLETPLRTSKRVPFRGCVRLRSMVNDNHTGCERLASFRAHIRAGLVRKSALKCRGGWGEKGPWKRSSSFTAQVGANHSFPIQQRASSIDFTPISRSRQASAASTVPMATTLGWGRVALRKKLSPASLCKPNGSYCLCCITRAGAEPTRSLWP